jgi:hypothetical protein
VLIAGNPGVDVRFRHQAGGLAWSLDSRRLEGEVGDRLASPRGLRALRQAIREGESRLDQGGSGPAGGPAGRGG